MITMSGSKRRAASMASAAVPGLGDDLEVVAAVEQGDQPLSNDLVVVDDEQVVDGRGRALGHDRAAPGWFGTSTMIRVPTVGSLSIRTNRPASDARSRMFAIPWCSR